MYPVFKAISLIVVHVILSLLYLGADIYTIVELYEHDLGIYAKWMIGNYLIPGFLEFIHWTWCLIIGECSFGEWIYWTIFSIFFPFSVLIHNALHACRGPNHFNRVKERVKVLNSIWALKSPLQIIVHMAVMLLQWRAETPLQRTSQLFSMVFHLAHLNWHMMEHYFFEASGKGQEDLFSFRLTIRLLFCNFFHIVFRCLVFAFWIMYLGGSENPYFPTILVGLGVLFALINFVIARWTVKTTVLKHFFTCFAGIFLPGAVFFSKDNFNGKKNTMKMFSKFARWNAFVFFWIVVIGNLILLGLYYDNHLTFTCHTHPPLTKNEPCRIYESLFYALFGKNFPGYKADAGFLWSWMFSWFLTCAHVGLSWAESCLI